MVREIIEYFKTNGIPVDTVILKSDALFDIAKQEEKIFVSDHVVNKGSLGEIKQEYIAVIMYGIKAIITKSNFLINENTKGDCRELD